MQIVSTVLDIYVIIATYELCIQRSSQGEMVHPKTPLVIGTVLLVRIFAILRVVALPDDLLPGRLNLLAPCRLDGVLCETRISQLAVSGAVPT